VQLQQQPEMGMKAIWWDLDQDPGFLDVNPGTPDLVLIQIKDVHQLLTILYPHAVTTSDLLYFLGHHLTKNITK